MADTPHSLPHALSTERADYQDGSMPAIKRWFAETTNREHRQGGPQDVIEGDDNRGGNQDPPVAIEREERQRPEHMEMRLDASAGQVDEQRAHQHLRNGYHIAG